MAHCSRTQISTEPFKGHGGEKSRFQMFRGLSLNQLRSGCLLLLLQLPMFTMERFIELYFELGLK